MKLVDVQKLFPFNPCEAYHEDLKYAIPFVSIEDLPESIRDAEVTHCSAIDDVIVIYCKG